MSKVVIVDSAAHDYELERSEFVAEGVEVVVCDCTSEDEIVDAARDATVLLVTSSTITASVIDGLQNCRLIMRYGVGLDNIDVEHAARRGIPVCNAARFGTCDVAEHTFALLLACVRKVAWFDRALHQGWWMPAGSAEAVRLHGKTMGVIGFGRIAKTVCGIAAGFSMVPAVYDPFVDGDAIRSHGYRAVELDELLTDSDFVTLHAPLNSETRHMISKEEFTRMKESAVLINTSRGALVNEEDLIAALESRQIAGAGLDVFEEEPIQESSPLRRLDNVVVTPHVAWNTTEAVADLHREVIDDVVRVLRGQAPHNAVTTK